MTVLNYPNPDKVPTEVKNAALKYAFCYIVQELLRLKHNEMGAKFRNGEITKQEWNDFLTNWHNPRERVVITDLLELRELCKGYAAQFKDKINLEDIPV